MLVEVVLYSRKQELSHHCTNAEIEHVVAIDVDFNAKRTSSANEKKL